MIPKLPYIDSQGLCRWQQLRLWTRFRHDSERFSGPDVRGWHGWISPRTP